MKNQTELLETLCADALAKTDLLGRYQALTEDQAKFDTLVSAIKQRRGLVLAELAKTTSKSVIAHRLGITRQRVAQLIDEAA